MENSSDEKLLEKVEIVPGLFIPRALTIYWRDIEKTKLPCILINAIPQNDLELKQSKLGHYPYLPINFNYPTDSEGKFMYPLAQINLKDLPALEGYPSSGYLQFYISAFDGQYGLDLTDPQSQKNFRVLYFEEHEVKQHMTDFSFLNNVMEIDIMPVSKPHLLTFIKKEEYGGINDVRNKKNGISDLYNLVKKFPTIKNALWKICYDTFRCGGHKIGGYANFTQDDPRIFNDRFRDYVLLFQLDSDNEIMWGDVGVANFFIHPDNLAKKDFSNIMYNWDCG